VAGYAIGVYAAALELGLVTGAWLTGAVDGAEDGAVDAVVPPHAANTIAKDAARTEYFSDHLGECDMLLTPPLSPVARPWFLPWPGLVGARPQCPKASGCRED
jgi:hypothetical protein